MSQETTAVEQTMLDNPISMTGKELSNTNPVKHSFAENICVREIYNPANEFIITAIHAQSHPFFLLKGSMSIITHEGIETIDGLRLTLDDLLEAILASMTAFPFPPPMNTNTKRGSSLSASAASRIVLSG